MADVEALKQVIATYSRRLTALQQQQERFGPNTPPSVLIEIESLQQELNRLNEQLHRLSGEKLTPPQILGDTVSGSNTRYPELSTVGGDKITIGDISGSSGIAIGRGAQSTVRTVNTGGGDYAEGNIDKRKGTFVSGDQFNMSGNFSGAILNIKSTLSNVTQSIGAAPQGDATTKAQLQALIEELSAELQKAPAEKAEEAEQAAKRAESAVAEAIKAKPDKDDVEYSLSRLKKAAENIGKVLPAVIPIAVQIAETLRKMIGR